MNIGFLYLHAPYGSMGSLYRVRNLCMGLAALGHTCYIITPYDYDFNWDNNIKFIKISTSKIFNPFAQKIYKLTRTILDNSFLSKLMFFNPYFFKLLINRISNSLLTTLKETSLNLDVIIGETEMAGLILLKIKNQIPFPIIIDYQNFWPEELIENKIIKRSNKTYRNLLDLERRIIKYADFIITPSEALKVFLKEHFDLHNNSKIEAVINGGTAILDIPLKKELPPKIIYAGMVVQRSNIELFFKSIPYVLEKYPNTEIYVTKKGEQLNKAMKLVKKMNLNINFYWKETYQDFLDLLSKCHVGIVTSAYELTRSLGFVTKIYDYFSVGVPVVGNDIGGWSSIISDERLGLLSSNNPKEMAEKIIEIIENKQLALEFGKREIQLLKEKYSVTKSAQSLIKVINKVLS